MERCICDNCGTEIFKYKSAVRNQNFCNSQCFKEYREKNRITRRCKQCGKEFSIARSVIGEKTNSSGNFCNRKCYNEYQKTLTGEKNNHYSRFKIHCKNCGKEVWQIPSRSKVYKNKFCSLKCRSEYHFNYVGGDKNCNWVGGHSNYRGNFESVKTKHFSNNKKCEICGTTDMVHIHHIIPYRLTQDNSLVNLVPLCAKHHKIIESRTVKLLKDRTDYENVRKEVKIMITEEKHENYQDEIIRNNTV